MDRRRLTKGSMATAIVCDTSSIASLFSQMTFAAGSNIADGRTQRFDFSILQSMVYDLAQTAWCGTPRPLSDTLATMTPRAYNSIQYDTEKSLWYNVENRQLDAQSFHIGVGFRCRARMFFVDPAIYLVRGIHFRPELFKYNDAGADTKQLEGQSGLGLTDFRMLKAPELAHHSVVSFLDASCFRVVDDTYQYGLSTRSLAIDTYANSKKEFPDFTAFRFDMVKPGATTFTAYTLLGSASITSAYKLIVHYERNQVIMDMGNHLHVHKDIKQLGVASITSMLSYGTNECRMCDAIHSQIHGSDRLFMWQGNGGWICRPLSSPQKLQFNAYTDNNPKGFGLLQLDRDFSHYQDIIGWHNRRPSLRVEPRNKWGKDTIGLMEIPATGETLNNIVCLWQPRKAVKAGDESAFQYHLCWSTQPLVHCPLARVMAMHIDVGGFPEGWAPGGHYPERRTRRFTVDFVGGDLKVVAPKGTEPVIISSNGETEQIEILCIESTDGYRIQSD